MSSRTAEASVPPSANMILALAAQHRRWLVAAHMTRQLLRTHTALQACALDPQLSCGRPSAVASCTLTAIKARDVQATCVLTLGTGWLQQQAQQLQSKWRISFPRHALPSPCGQTAVQQQLAYAGA